MSHKGIAKRFFVRKEETTEKQKERIMKFKAEGDRRFAEEGRTAEITVNLDRRGDDERAPS